jgi:integrase
MRIQRGHIWRVKKGWYGRWNRDEVVSAKDLTPKERTKLKLSPDFDGMVTLRRQHSEKLCDATKRYRNASAVQPLLDAKLKEANEGRSAPEGTMTVARYVKDHFFPYTATELKPSTANGYRSLWKMYLEPHAGEITMRDFRCVDATNILAAIYRGHKLSSITLRHCKWLLSSIFLHAKRAGVIDGENPVEDAGIPKKAKTGSTTHAYSVQEIFAMLNTLDGIARATIAVTFFGGLRPSEARAIEWKDFDKDKKVLRIKASMWRTHLGTPKTDESAGFVPVAQVLADILAELPRTSERFILAGPSGKPIDLHNLAARVVRPGLERCSICHEQKSEHKPGHAFELDTSIPKWRGWYACRRGLATVATSVDSALAAKSLLRHSNISVTEQFYIKSVPAEATRAMDKISSLFHNEGGRPQ